MKPIAIVITGISARRMINGLVLITPRFKARVNGVLVGVQQAARLNHLRQDWVDCHLLDIGNIRMTTSIDKRTQIKSRHLT